MYIFLFRHFSYYCFFQRFNRTINTLATYRRTILCRPINISKSYHHSFVIYMTKFLIVLWIISSCLLTFMFQLFCWKILKKFHDFLNVKNNHRDFFHWKCNTLAIFKLQNFYYYYTFWRTICYGNTSINNICLFPVPLPSSFSVI